MVSSTSALILFCSRLLLIANMYRPHQTLNRYTLEFLIYTLVAAFGLWPIPTTIWHIPDQVAAKSVIVHQSQEPYYPDCLFEPVAIVTTDPGSGDENVAILTIVNHISVGIAIFVSAKLAFWMLSQRMVNQSEATKKLHKKFNQRTIFQAIVYLSFASIPFTVLQLTIVFNVHVPGLTYFIDFFSENHPTACAVTLFLYYDPYQLFLLKCLGIRKSYGKGAVKSLSTAHLDKMPIAVSRV